MPNSKTSILFVNTQGAARKGVQIPTHVLLYWRRYLIGFIAAIIILGGVNSLLIYQKTSAFYQAKLERANKIRTMVDMKDLKTALQSIDSGVARINTYLKARGLATMTNKQVGGTAKFELTDLNEVASSYDTYLKDVEMAMHQVPMGYAYNGERSSRFGFRSNPFGGVSSEFHPGIDFKGPSGAPIKATAAGLVTFAGYRGGYGNCVIIKHKSGYETLYGHMSALKVALNETIDGNTIVGLLGSTGRSTGPHLHYEVMRHGEKLNPEPFLVF